MKPARIESGLGSHLSVVKIEFKKKILSIPRYLHVSADPASPKSIFSSVPHCWRASGARPLFGLAFSTISHNAGRAWSNCGSAHTLCWTCALFATVACVDHVTLPLLLYVFFAVCGHLCGLSPPSQFPSFSSSSSHIMSALILVAFGHGPITTHIDPGITSSTSSFLATTNEHLKRPNHLTWLPANQPSDDINKDRPLFCCPS